MSPADFAAMAGNGIDGGNSWWCFLLIILFFICGAGGWGAGAQPTNGVLDATLAASAAQGGYVTSSQLNDALRLQEIQSGQQGINANLSAAEQRLTANQTSLLAGQSAIAQAQQACCADVKYSSAMNTASINENVTAQAQRVLDQLSQNKVEQLQQQVSQLQLQNAMAGVVRYPMQAAYTNGQNPFCGCSCCGA